MLEGDINMKAVVLERTCKAEDLKVSEVEIPKVKTDWVLVKVLGFGINRAEVILRDHEADEDYINLLVIPGIECVGVVIDASNTRFKNGDKIAALMGGMGRSFNGGYAEYALLPEKIVFRIDDNVFDNLTLEEIIAVPETYFTAYGSIKSLNLKKEDTLLIRGATSSLGLSVMKLAKAIGCKILATSRSKDRFDNLKTNGADECFIDDGCLTDKLNCDKVLELIGPKTLEDSMKCLNEGGICCVTGILGGIEYFDKFDPIKVIPNVCYLTSFFSNYPTQEIMDNLFDFIVKNNIKPNISKVFTNLEDISKAHALMESNNAQGKIVFML